MSDRRLIDCLDHMLEASRQACAYVEGLEKSEFLADKRHAAGRDHEYCHHRRSSDEIIAEPQ